MKTTQKSKTQQAEIFCEYGPVDEVHRVTFHSTYVWFTRGDALDPESGRELAKIAALS